MREEEPTRWLESEIDGDLRRILASSADDEVEGRQVARLRARVAAAVIAGGGVAAASSSAGVKASASMAAKTAGSASAKAGSAFAGASQIGAQAALGSASMATKLVLASKVLGGVALVALGATELPRVLEPAAQAPAVAVSAARPTRVQRSAPARQTMNVRAAQAAAKEPASAVPSSADARCNPVAPAAVAAAPSEIAAPAPSTPETPRPRLRAAALNQPRAAEPSLEQEAALIARMRAAGQADAASVLTLATEHRQAFRKGLLAPERDLLALEAQLKLGQLAQACLSARRIAAAHSHDAYQQRALEVLRDTPYCTAGLGSTDGTRR